MRAGAARCATLSPPCPREGGGVQGLSVASHDNVPARANARHAHPRGLGADGHEVVYDGIDFRRAESYFVSGSGKYWWGKACRAQ
jgi:hypothetical protein